LLGEDWSTKHSFKTVKRAKRSESEIGGLALLGSLHYD